MPSPILIAGSNQKWDVLLGIVAGVGCVLGGAGFWREIFPMGPVLIALGVLLVLGCSILWIVRRVQRRWCVIRPSDFVIDDGRHEETFRDEDVFAMSLSTKKNYTNGVYHSTTRAFTLWVEEGHGTRRLVMTTKLKEQDYDALAVLVGRIAGQLHAEASRSLAAGHRVEGKGWVIERDNLVVRGRKEPESIPLGEITAADIFDRHVCVWRRGIDEPVARFAETGENAWILLLLLQERAAKQKGGEPGEGLGRILFERKPSRVWAWIGYPLGGLLVLFAGLALVVAVANRKPEPLLVSVIFLPLALLIVVGTMASRRRIFRCHEYGVHSVRWFRERRLRYTDVASFTCSAIRMYVKGAYSGTQMALTFEPVPEIGTGTVHYAANVQNADDAIDMLRDHVAQVVAGRLGREFAAGRPVRWLEHLTFEPEGLNYRPAGFIGRKEPIFIPYDEIERYAVEDGTFRIWQAGRPKSVVNESVAGRNFFPGYVLLLTVLHPPQTPREEATEPVWS